jgi:hypothetical protein
MISRKERCLPLIKYFLLTTSVCLQVPESPIWLISQGRPKDAEAALCWLRGWVDRSAVQQELAELMKYHETVTLKSAHKLPKDTVKDIPLETQNLSDCKQAPELTGLLLCSDVKLLNSGRETEQVKDYNFNEPLVRDRTRKMGEELVNGMSTAASHDESERMISGKEKSIIEEGFPRVGRRDGGRRVSKPVAMVRLLLERETLRPLFLTVSFFSFCALGGIPSLRPFLVEVVESLHSPIESSWSTVSPVCIRSTHLYRFPQEGTD